MPTHFPGAVCGPRVAPGAEVMAGAVSGAGRGTPARSGGVRAPLAAPTCFPHVHPGRTAERGGSVQDFSGDSPGKLKNWKPDMFQWHAVA